MFDTEETRVGRQYLDTLRKREARTGAVHQATDAAVDAIADAVTALVRRVLEHQTTTPMPLRTISHLIGRADVERYESALSGVGSAPDFRFLVIGPRAPYSFCALDGEAGGAHGMNLAD